MRWWSVKQNFRKFCFENRGVFFFLKLKLKLLPSLKCSLQVTLARWSLFLVRTVDYLLIINFCEVTVLWNALHFGYKCLFKKMLFWLLIFFLCQWQRFRTSILQNKLIRNFTFALDTSINVGLLLLTILCSVGFICFI